MAGRAAGRPWWAEDPAQVAARYGPSLDGEDPTALYLGLEDGVPVGFVQVYRFADEPAYAVSSPTCSPSPRAR